jgi:hypothetical protein
MHWSMRRSDSGTVRRDLRTPHPHLIPPDDPHGIVPGYFLLPVDPPCSLLAVVAVLQFVDHDLEVRSSVVGTEHPGAF